MGRAGCLRYSVIECAGLTNIIYGQVVPTNGTNAQHSEGKLAGVTTEMTSYMSPANVVHVNGL